MYTVKLLFSSVLEKGYTRSMLLFWQSVYLILELTVIHPQSSFLVYEGILYKTKVDIEVSPLRFILHTTEPFYPVKIKHCILYLESINLLPVNLSSLKRVNTHILQTSYGIFNTDFSGLVPIILSLLKLLYTL